MLALVASTLWGLAGVLAAAVFDEISVVRVAEVRAIGGAVAFLPYVLWKREAPSRQAWPLILAFGVSLATVTYTFYMAINLIGVGPGATIQFIAPVYLLAWNRFIRHEPLKPIAWLAAASALVGVSLIAQVWDGPSVNLPGLAAGIVSSVAFAFYLALGERLSTHLSPPAIMAYGFGTTSVIWLVVAPLWTFPATALSTSGWWQIAAIVVIGTIIPFAVEIRALGMAPAPLIGLAATWEPLFAAILAWIFLTQLLSTSQVIGGLLILGAIALIQATSEQSTPDLHPAV